MTQVLFALTRKDAFKCLGMTSREFWFDISAEKFKNALLTFSNIVRVLCWGALLCACARGVNIAIGRVDTDSLAKPIFPANHETLKLRISVG